MIAAIRYCPACAYVAHEPLEAENGDVLCPHCPPLNGARLPLVPLSAGTVNYLITARTPSPAPHAARSGSLGLLLALGLLEYRETTIGEFPPRPYAKPVLDYTAKGAAVVYRAYKMVAAPRVTVVDLTDRRCENRKGPATCGLPATHLDRDLVLKCNECDPIEESTP